MEGEHAQMWQIPCKMTNSSSKPLQTLGKWYQPRNPKKILNLLKKTPKTISHPFNNRGQWPEGRVEAAAEHFRHLTAGKRQA